MKVYRTMIPVMLFAVLFSALVPIQAGAAEAGIDFNIRFFDRRIYYAASDINEPIFIQATISNNSPNTYRFKLADDRIFTLDFDVRTVTNRLVEPADTLIRRRTAQQHVFFRDVTIESGESFSFVEDLRNYVKLNEPGSFIVRASIFPELMRSGTSTGRTVILESQRLSLNLRPPVVTGPDGIPLEMDVATGAVLVRERLAPDQVVEYMLTARQRSQWERFFLYLDLESMLSQDPVRRRRWLAESETGRRRMIEQFRLELQNSTIEGSISVIPTEFVIERTQYNSSEGTVTVLQKFRSNNFTELKRYTYVMRLINNFWMITDYSVVNLGTE